MKVKDLIQILKDYSPEMEVILSKDAEGNKFSPLCDYSIGNYEPDTTWEGHFSIHQDEEFELEDNSICLWPIS